MSNPLPFLDNEARKAGAQRSLEVRRARAALKAELTAGVLTLAEAILRPEAQTMRVADLLRACPFVGDLKTAKRLRLAKIPPDKRVQGCGALQIERLLAQF